MILPIDDVWLSAESTTRVAGHDTPEAPASTVPPQGSHLPASSTFPGSPHSSQAPSQATTQPPAAPSVPQQPAIRRNGAQDENLTSIRDDGSNGAHMTSTNGSDHSDNGWSSYEPGRFDPTAFDPGPDLPPLPTLRPLPTIRPLNRWTAEPLSPPAAPTVLSLSVTPLPSLSVPPPAEPAAAYSLGAEPVGPEPVGPEPVGPEPVGPEPVGPEPVGPE
ncbi:hypothetical protein ABIB25_005923, partial [Nakamurella sp. UYEF19]